MPQPSSTARAAGAALGAAALLFLWPVTLGDRILSQADLLYFHPPWSVCRPADQQLPANGLLSDQSMHFYPARELARSALRGGEMPLWNPYILMGAPLLADMVSAVLSPFNIFSYVGDLQRGFGWGALARLIVAGAGMLVLCRQLGVAPPGALLAALSFMLCAFQVVWLNHPQTNVSALLPWALVAVERLLQRRRAATALLGIVAALLLLGGHPETVMHVAVVAGAFLLYRTGHYGWGTASYGELRRLALGVAGGALLGAGLAALVLIPFLELLAQSAIWELRGSFARNPFVLPPSAIVTALAPDVFGSPLAGSDGAPLNYNERTLYAGFLPLCLALLSLRRLRADGRVRFFALLGVFCLAIVLGVWPIFDLFTALPVLHHAPNHRLILVCQFCMAALAGIEADWLMREQARGAAPGRAALRLTAVLATLPLAWWMVSRIVAISPAPVDLWSVLHPLLAGVAAFVLFRLLRQRAIGAHVWGIAACALTFADLFAFGFGYNPAVARQHVFACEPESIRYLRARQGTFRIAAPEWLTLMPNTASVYRLQDVRGYELPAPGRLLPFYTAGLHGSSNGAVYVLQQLDAAVLRLLSLANVRFIMSQAPLPADLGLQPVYDGEVRIYENPGALPRAFVVRDVELVGDGDAALRRLTDPSLDLARVAVVEAPDEAAEALRAMPAGAAAAGCADSVAIAHYAPREVRIDVDLCRPGLVVLSDTYDAGWHVEVDGESQTMHRADFLFRGVHADAGRHTIRYRYDPFSYRLGIVISIASSLVLLATLVRSPQRHRDTETSEFESGQSSPKTSET